MLAINYRDQLNRFREITALYIRQEAYKHGDIIDKFIKKYDIGESNYGELMDALGKSEAVHRLKGHHLIFDFPLNKPQNIWNFLEHELSDIFTKQGLPILPEKILKDTGLLKYCKSLSHNWNFVNGFDILVGTIAIYVSIKQLKSAFNQEISIDSFKDFANMIGVGALELAIAFSTANPFLLIGATLQLVAGIKALLNDSAVMYFSKVHAGLKIEFTLQTVKIQNTMRQNSIHKHLDDVKLKTTLNKVKYSKF